MARIVFLHGASSSGKTTLADAIREVSDDPWLHLSIDHLRDSDAWRPQDYPDWGAARPAFFDGFHRAIGGFADAGNDLIVEHILDTSAWHPQLQTLLTGHRVCFVGLVTPVETLTAREIARGDRELGSAARDARSVHTGLRYDLTLSGDAVAKENAAQVLEALLSGPEPSGFFSQ